MMFDRMEDNSLKSKVNELKDEVSSLKDDMSNLWIKHTFYNTALFIFGLSSITLYLLSDTNISYVKDISKDISKDINNLKWDLINQSIYVIDGKIIILGNNK